MKRRTLAALLCLGLLPALTPWSAPAAADPAADPTRVRVEAGPLRGRVDGEVVRFSGVPYAAPPVGHRRWTAPEPVEPWTGVRDATAPAASCPQLLGVDVVGSEDCLYLDLVRPVRPSRPGPLPVIVWVHGGNLTSGAGSQYDGARLASGGDVLVVTVNYRLGALGFLAAPALGGEPGGSGNYGLLDQAEALRWVGRNAAAFGGDPDRITLAGQSAGARSVCAQLASPGSRGLFQRAVVQSGPCAGPVMSWAEAEAKGGRAIAQVGCADAGDVAGCLREVPASVLVTSLADRGVPFLRERRDDPWGPVAGTPFLPWQPGEALRDGRAARVPLLLGSTRDEARGAVLGALPDLTPGEYESMVGTVFGADAGSVLSAYPAGQFASPAVALASVLTDWGYSCPTFRTARAASRHAPVYAYELVTETPEVDGLRYGAYHSWDLPFLWDTSIPFSQFPELSPAQQRLSETMIGYWTRFARTGDPALAGQPAWPAFGRHGTVLGLAEVIAPTRFVAEHRCGFWDGG